MLTDFILARLQYNNRPFASSKISHFQSESNCEATGMKMIFNYDANKTHFHKKGFALSLVLKVRFFGTRKWPIVEPFQIVGTPYQRTLVFSKTVISLNLLICWHS